MVTEAWRVEYHMRWPHSARGHRLLVPVACGGCVNTWNSSLSRRSGRHFFDSDSAGLPTRSGQVPPAVKMTHFQTCSARRWLHQVRFPSREL